MTDGFDVVQVRAAKVEDVDDEHGTVRVKLVPYEVEAELWDGAMEVFTRGAFAAAVGNPSRCKMTDQQHNRNVVIGNAIELRDEPDGHYGTLRIADTVAGRDVLTLLRAGVLDEMSVEFQPMRKHMRVTNREGGVLIRHDKATLLGVSPVSEGAYGQGARLLSVRAAEADRARERELAYLASLNSGTLPGGVPQA
jgi:HK97 family phage prohead protease